MFWKLLHVFGPNLWLSKPIWFLPIHAAAKEGHLEAVQVGNINLYPITIYIVFINVLAVKTCFKFKYFLIKTSLFSCQLTKFNQAI